MAKTQLDIHRNSPLTELAEEPEGDHDEGAPLDDPPAADLGDPDGPDVLAVAGGPVASAPEAGQHAAQALHGDPSVDGGGGRRRSSREASTGVVVPDTLDSRGQDPGQHPHHPGGRDRGDSPLEGIREPEPVRLVEKLYVPVSPGAVGFTDDLRDGEDGAETPHEEDRDQNREQFEDLGHVPQVLGAHRHYHDGPS